MNDSPRRPLQRSILATLAYFDVFDYPLRVEEIWRWLYVMNPDDRSAVERSTPADVENALRNEGMSKLIDRAGSFVALRGRSGIVATRMERKVGSKRKWKRARLAARMMRFVPWVRFIGVVNTLAIDNARPESDIDFFVVVRRGRMWLTRLLVTLLVQALGIRRHGTNIADRVCLSFYVSDQAMNLEAWSLEHDDPYLTFWVTQVVPLFERPGTWRRFREANAWIQTHLPHGLAVAPTPYFGDLWFAKALRMLPEMLLTGAFGDVVERLARWLQQRVMEGKRKMPRPHPTDVVVSDTVLKFHEADRRAEYREAFLRRFRMLGDPVIPLESPPFIHSQ